MKCLHHDAFPLKGIKVLLLTALSAFAVVSGLDFSHNLFI
jgi:hypothetical protein